MKKEKVSTRTKALFIGAIALVLLSVGSVASAAGSRSSFVELVAEKVAALLVGGQIEAPLGDLLGAASNRPIQLVHDYVNGLFVSGSQIFDKDANATLPGTLSVTGASSFTDAATFNKHIITGGGTPTVAVGGASWAAGTLTGNDSKGVVSSTPAAGTAGQITVNFATAWGAAPICVISAADTNTATSSEIVYVTSSVSSFAINYKSAANPVANKWNYHCIQ